MSPTTTHDETQAELRRTRGRLANTTRHHPSDITTIAELRSELTRLKLTQAVEEAVAASPPISPEKAIEIVDLLLRGVAGGRADVA